MSKITTVEQLQALPEGQILADKNGYPVWKDSFMGWSTANGSSYVDPELIIQDGAPLTVLTPDRSGFILGVDRIGEDAI